MSIYGSGEKEWIGPLTMKKATDTVTNMRTHVVSNDQLKLAFELKKDIPSILSYDNDVLKENYNTTYPVVRFNINTAERKGVEFQRAIVNRVLSSMTVKVNVQGASSVHLENDNGVLQANKPFFPFTPQPIKASNFYIDYDEVFAKAWTNITINFDWKNTPADFSTWYNAYGNSPTINDNYFKATKEVLHKENWESAVDDEQILFDKNTDGTYSCEIDIDNNNYKIDKAGPVRLRLDTPFLHDKYPNLYTQAIIGSTTNSVTLSGDNTTVTTSASTSNIPNVPYTPLAENITISYTAEETKTIESQPLPISTANPIKTSNTQGTYDGERIKLFHVHPFGQCEEHNHLKLSKHQKGIKDVYDDVSINTHLLPKYCQGGELFIGLEKAEVQQNISLLVQVLEGSEDPQAVTFEDKESIQWAVLCDNKWMSLNDEITSNNTANFLRTWQ